MLTAEQRKKKQRLIRAVIGCCLLLIPFLGYIQRSLLSGDLSLPLSSTVLIFALININGLLLLLMLYLVLRNLVELAFERNQRLLGSRLRTRLVISFISLSLIPTAILFIIALRFVSTSMDYCSMPGWKSPCRPPCSWRRTPCTRARNRSSTWASTLPHSWKTGWSISTISRPWNGSSPPVWSPAFRPHPTA